MTYYKSASDFEITRELACGIFGSAKLVRARADRGEYVLKAVNITRLREHFNQAINPEFVDKLVELKKTEYIKLEGLRHANIVRVFDSFEETADNGGDLLYMMVMEHCDGSDLLSAINEARAIGNFFHEAQIQTWLLQIASAMKFLHDRNFVHRDIQPKNIFMLSNRQTVRLGGFGLVRGVDGMKTNFNSLILAPDMWPYCSPQYHHSDRPLYSKACDVWALGVTLYQIVTLQLPFTSIDTLITKEAEPFPSLITVSEDLQSLTMRMLEKDIDTNLEKPPKRPTIDQVLFDAFLMREMIGPESEGTPTRTPPAHSEEDILENALKFDLVRSSEIIPNHLKEPICLRLKEELVNAIDLLKKFSDSDVESMFSQRGTRDAVLKWRTEEFHNWKAKEFPVLFHDFRSAVRSGNLDLVKEIFRSESLPQPDGRHLLLEHKDETGQDVLNWSAFNGHLNIAKFLVTESETISNISNIIEAKGFCERTPLLQACCNGGHLDVLRYFFEEKGANIDAEDDQGCKAIHLACEFGCFEVVSYLLEKRPSWLEAKSGKVGRTPLLHAATKGNMPVVEFLVDVKKADLDAEGIEGSKAIDLAARFGTVAIVDYLLEKKPKWLELRTSKANRTPLLHAAAYGNLPVVEYLVSQKEANIKAVEKSESGASALHLAAYFGHRQIVAYLLERKPDLVNLKDKQGLTAVELARSNNKDGIVALLTENAPEN